MSVPGGNYYTTGECIAAFRDAMAARGLVTDDQIVPDGEWHRFHNVGDARRDRSGKYVLHVDGVPTGLARCHRRKIEIKWVASRKAASLTEWDRREIERKKQKRAVETRKAQERAAERACDTLGQAFPASDDHPYLVEKGVPAYGIWCGTWRNVPNTLLIPMRNADGKVVSLQAIFADKNAIGRGKDYPAGAQTKGCYFTIGKITYAGNRPVVVIAEGYATGASVHLATGLCVAIAFTCGNLLDVGRVVRRKFPDAVILFAADDDRWNDKNSGRIEAEAAARAVGGLCVLPVFAIPPREKADNKTDFNDLHRCEGLNAVRDQIAYKVADAAQRCAC